MKSGLTPDRSQLDGLMVFLAVAELRGFRAAAKRLGVTPSAVSQSIRVLEARVGVPLIARSTRSVSLTEAGGTLLAHARPAVQLLTAGLDAAGELGQEVSGRLRINVPRQVLMVFAQRLLPDLLDLYPRLVLEMVGEDELVDIVDEGFDAGVRVGTVVEADMIAVWLTPPEPLAVICSPAYVERYGAPDRPRDLAAHRCILLRRSGADIGHWRFVVEEKSIAMQVAGPLITNDCEVCIQAALCGVGLFCLPRSVVCDHLANGDLVTVLEPYVETFPGLSLYYPSQRHLLPKLRAFIDFATERMRAADFH